MIVEIAEAVKDALNGAPEGSFSLEFAAERVALAEFDLKDHADLHVTVVPRQRAAALLDRSRNSHDIQVDVAVSQRLKSAACDDVDPLLGLVEEIMSFLSRRPMAGCPWLGAQNVPVYSPEHLRQYNLFFSVITLTYRGVQDARAPGGGTGT